MKSKLKSNADLKREAEHFFDSARKSVIDDPKFFKSILMGDGMMRNGIMFKGNGSVLEAQRSLIARCIKLLGSKMGHEKEIDDIAWECVCQSLIGDQQISDLSEMVVQFTDKLIEQTQNQFKYIAPNYAIRFEKGITSIKIGPVEALLTSEVLPEINENKSLIAAIGAEFKMSIIGEKIHFEFPTVVWRVSTQVSRGHLEEEVIWLINVAISLLRLSYPNNKYYGLFPRIGERETHPIHLQPITKQGLAFSEHGAWGGETTARKIYEIDEEVSSVVATKTFQDRVNAIFTPTKRSLSERFSQGLGWMSRGRQTADRAEKFLFFFTAIESLLSSDDKAAPVVQTVSRYVAVILQDEAISRFELANKIKSLYALRSALVHTGKRGVSNSDVSTIQIVAENVYWVVMDRMKLNSSFESFHASLSEASYGLPWLRKDDESGVVQTPENGH